MPWGLTRFHHSGQSHFVTFCCYHRRRLFITDASRRIFESALERVRRSFGGNPGTDGTFPRFPRKQYQKPVNVPLSPYCRRIRELSHYFFVLAFFLPLPGHVYASLKALKVTTPASRCSNSG